MKVRIEIHLEPKEVILLDKIAKKEGRSRKNFCEQNIKKAINENTLFTPAKKHD